MVASLNVTGQLDLKKQLDSIANAGIDQGIPGIQILISNPTSSPIIYNYGFQDIAKTNEVNDSTHWRYGSVTKIFTAVMILQLVSEGKLSLNDQVSQYIDLKQHNDAGISVKQLLNHSSGLYNYTKTGKLTYEDTMQTCLAYSLKRKLDFKPGTKYKYCNTGFLILGLIIEKITNRTYQENIVERIFEPCGLESMQYCMDAQVPPNTAKGYERRRKKYKDVTNIDHKWANAAGAVLGNLDDLQAFTACLFDGALLDSVLLSQMISPTNFYRDLDAGGTEWYNHAVGLCWDVNIDKAGHTMYVSHGGNTRGYNVDIHYNTQTKLTIAIGMNLFPNGKYKPVFSTQNRMINAVHEYYKFDP